MPQKPLNAGQLQAFQNATHRPGTRRPAFEGRVAMPWDGNTHEFVLWGHTTEHGHTYFNGKGKSTPLPPEQQIAALTGAATAPDPKPLSYHSGDRERQMQPRQLVLFRVPDPEGNEPNYRGYYHPAEPSRPLLQLAVWEELDKHGRVYLSGKARAYLPEAEKSRRKDASKAAKPARSRQPIRTQEPDDEDAPEYTP